MLSPALHRPLPYPGIERMKAMLGPQYTKKLEDMYQDLGVSEDASKVQHLHTHAHARTWCLVQSCASLAADVALLTARLLPLCIPRPLTLC